MPVISLKRTSGGVRVDDKKDLSAGSPIEPAGIPGELVLFLSQHTGAPSKPVVKVQDLVKRGQLLAEPQGAISAALHAPTSGKVKAIEPRYHPIQGRLVDAIVLEPDGKNEVFEGVVPRARDLDSISGEEIIAFVREIGLVGLGGAAFPTAVKLTPPADKPIDTYLLNGAECEPYLTSDYRLMLEEAEVVIFGFRALLKAARVARGIVCIEDNKPEAISAMQRAMSPFPELDLAVLPSRYPRGGEKQLIEAVLGREVPPAGLPLDVGVIVSNVGTAFTLGKAIRTGLPLVERVISVTGEGVTRPSNFLALIGTPVSYLIEKAGGFSGTPGKVIMGGPMMGISVKSLDVPVLKGTSGIVVLKKEQVKKDKMLPCIRCGRCVDACPLRLLPVWMAAYAERGLLEEAERARVLDCCECGACAYECPAKRPLVQWIRMAKSEILAKRRAQNHARK
ncbi:MAG: electron transport complex subunit RsxC [Candidatus Fermentithermobacillus carboniphilus]|uniref:Ion-translocating oxidoreductase complex subunit C n=1 Tax=Candidatus Fermentithermobacillus carboniphilus TaxID=3085328 RepID=A0AAT9LES6_9FIRM|nr:MAG: electron transport complex subunit RsxC [Candidatus Fermentithermobacillus carboniphilus]